MDYDQFVQQKRRAEVATGTPEQRLAASGFIVGMKSEPLSKSILKNSKLG